MGRLTEAISAVKRPLCQAVMVKKEVKPFGCLRSDAYLIGWKRSGIQEAEINFLFFVIKVGSQQS